MPYPKKLLNSYETVALDMHPHWWFFSDAAFALLGSIILVILRLVFLDTTGNVNKVVNVILIALIVVSLLFLLVRYAKWTTTNFVITSDRLIFRQGLFAKSGIEIPLERVNNVNFNQSLFERILGAGDLLIESGGEDGRQRFTDIRRPEKVQNLIHAQMETNEQRRYGGGAVAAAAAAMPVDVATQLEKLEGLLQRGSLSQAEFDAQKARLLGS
jgi:uncharacterized membrane protein YdbT with pleckstrin-like domain